MAPQDLPPPVTQPSSDDAQRKLWFEYLAKLNDRQLQSSRASGFTPWALLAVAAAILYHGVPRIPAFLSIPGGTTAALVLLALEIDALSLGGVVVLALIVYCGPGIRARLLPEHNKRALQIQTWIGRTVLVAVVAEHFLVFARLSVFPFVRWVLFAFGLFWVWNLLTGIRTDLKRAREAKSHNYSPPVLSVTRASMLLCSILGAVVVFPIGATALVTLLLFLNSLQRASVPWVIPLGAATEILVLVVVLVVMFLTGLHSTSRSIFLDLERDVVLENLPPAEIRARFIREALGPSVGDWLETLYRERQKSFSRMAGLTDSLRARVQEIEAIDPKYSIERAGRAQKLLEELDGGLNRYIEELKGFLLQLRDAIRVSPPSTWETGILTRIAEQWASEQGQFAGTASSAGELRKRLSALAGPPK